MPDLLSVLVSSAIALIVALGVLYLAHRAGLTDVQAAVDDQRGKLVATLKTRVDVLEADNKRLTNRIEYLENELTTALRELERLRRYIIDNKVGSPDAGA